MSLISPLAGLVITPLSWLIASDLSSVYNVQLSLKDIKQLLLLGSKHSKDAGFTFPKIVK